MYISHETPEQIEVRLRRVIAAAELTILPGRYAYEEYPVDAFPHHRLAEALACVRDEQVWSVLAPATAATQEPFALFAFHFPPGLDNSGFVGWLATRLKAATGTGVAVICGCNSARGGIFDYWAAPAEVADAVLAELAALRATAP